MEDVLRCEIEPKVLKGRKMSEIHEMFSLLTNEIKDNSLEAAKTIQQKIVNLLENTGLRVAIKYVTEKRDMIDEIFSPGKADEALDLLSS